MEPNTRDTPMRHFTSFVVGILIMLVICIGGFVLYPLFNRESVDLDDQIQQFSQLDIELHEAHAKQEVLLKSYNFDLNKAAKKLSEQSK